MRVALEFFAAARSQVSALADPDGIDRHRLTNEINGIETACPEYRFCHVDCASRQARQRRGSHSRYGSTELERKKRDGKRSGAGTPKQPDRSRLGKTPTALCLKPGAVTVPTITLTELLGQNDVSEIAFLSMDIEQGEPAALERVDLRLGIPPVTVPDTQPLLTRAPNLLSVFATTQLEVPIPVGVASTR